MKKKLFLVCVLGCFLAVSSVFADHPDGWGVGIMARGGWGFSGGGFGGFALSFKTPMLPIYFGFNMDIANNYFGFGLTGDYYLIDNKLADLGGPTLGWYLGLGGFLGFAAYNDNDAVMS